MQHRIYAFLAILCVGSFISLDASGRAPAPSTFSLVVIPERPNLIRVSFDLIAQRPVALVAYRGSETGESVLHAWTGSQWVQISLDEYRGGNFLIKQPTRIILIGGERLLPIDLVEASNWGPLVMSVDATETDAFLNAMGRLYEFSSAEWRWFARRYNMDIEDVTQERDQISWYDQMTAARQRPPRRQSGDTPPVVPVGAEPVRPVRSEIPRQPVVQEVTPQPVLDEPVSEPAARPAPVPVAEPAQLDVLSSDEAKPSEDARQMDEDKRLTK